MYHTLKNLCVQITWDTPLESALKESYIDIIYLIISGTVTQLLIAASPPNCATKNYDNQPLLASSCLVSSTQTKKDREKPPSQPTSTTMNRRFLSLCLGLLAMASTANAQCSIQTSRVNDRTSVEIANTAYNAQIVAGITSCIRNSITPCTIDATTTVAALESACTSSSVGGQIYTPQALLACESSVSGNSTSVQFQYSRCIGSSCSTADLDASANEAIASVEANVNLLLSTQGIVCTGTVSSTGEIGGGGGGDSGGVTLGRSFLAVIVTATLTATTFFSV